MDRTIIEKIVDAGIRAPSGENCQPWRFSIKDNDFFLYNLPERDQSLYNFRQLGSLVSHGAVIENIIIAAKEFGYENSLTLFPIPAEPDCVAQITFVKNEYIIKDPLYESIFRRTSNRTTYKRHAMSEQEKTLLLESISFGDRSEDLIFLEDEDQKKKVSDALSYGDRLLFENSKIYNFLFSHIHWNLKKALKEKNGFYIKELGLNGMQEFIFKVLRNDVIRRFSNSIGFPILAAKGNSDLYKNSSAVGVILAKENTDKDFVEVGRKLQRVWLTATQMGYDIQLLTAIAFFMQRIQGGSAEDFTPEQQKGITAAYTRIKEIFAVKGKVIVIPFRIGKGKAVSYRSPRLAAHIDYI